MLNRLALLSVACSLAVVGATNARATVAASAAAPSQGASAANGKVKPARRARHFAPHPEPDGATGGDPATSSRTPGGPPPGTSSGITFPLKK